MWNWLQSIINLLFPRTITVTGGNVVRATVAVINASTVLTDAQVTPVVAALQIQLEKDFGPIWGVSANLVQVKQGQKPPAGSWWMVIGDDSTQVGALGFHDETPEGMPEGHVFAKTDLEDGAIWSVTISHELTEMLLNPDCNKTAQNSNGVFWAWEAADACEADNLSYPIVLSDGSSVKVSDFVLPSFFDPTPPAGARFDYCGHLSAPFSLAPGGYTSVFDPNNPASGWTMITADRDPKTLRSSRPPIGSRRDRIRTPRHLWLRSTYEFK